MLFRLFLLFLICFCTSLSAQSQPQWLKDLQEWTTGYQQYRSDCEKLIKWHNDGSERLLIAETKLQSSLDSLRWIRSRITILEKYIERDSIKIKELEAQLSHCQTRLDTTVKQLIFVTKWKDMLIQALDKCEEDKERLRSDSTDCHTSLDSLRREHDSLTVRHDSLAEQLLMETFQVVGVHKGRDWKFKLKNYQILLDTNKDYRVLRRKVKKLAVHMKSDDQVKDGEKGIGFIMVLIKWDTLMPDSSKFLCDDRQNFQMTEGSLDEIVPKRYEFKPDKHKRRLKKGYYRLCLIVKDGNLPEDGFEYYMTPKEGEYLGQNGQQFKKSEGPQIYFKDFILR